jgi:hypothetical protein
MYCWPCLLFVAEKGIWNGAGFDDNKFSQSKCTRENSEPPPRYHSNKNIWFYWKTHNLMNASTT